VPDVFGGGVVAMPPAHDLRLAIVRDVAVEHILGESRRQTHTLTPFAEVVHGTELIYPDESRSL
jgi:hypothetical protein